jgi:hypothetical protein
MDISKLVYSKMRPKTLKEPFEYQDMGKKYSYRFVDYNQFLKMLISEEEAEPSTKNSYLCR